MSASALLDSGASHSFIVAPQVTKFSNSTQKFLLCSAEPIKVHLAENYSVISDQIVHLPLQFADGAIYTVEFWVVPAFNHAILLGMPFLYTLNPSIDWKTHFIIYKRTI